MKFEESKKSLYNDSNLPVPRRKILEKANSYLTELRDSFEVRVRDDFYSKDRPFVDRVPIIIEMTFSDFNRFVEEKEYLESIDYQVQTQYGLYYLKNEEWIKKNDKQNTFNK